MADHDSTIIDGNKNDDEDIMLELSIGGIFGRPKKKNWNLNELNLNNHDNVEYNRDIRCELKRKREENIKAFVGFGSVVENKEWLDTKISLPQNGGDLLDVGHVGKKEKINGNNNNLVLRPMACRIFKTCQGNMNMNSDGSGGFSDGQCSCNQGNPADNCRSISSNSQLDQQLPSTSMTRDPLDPSDEPASSSTQTLKLTNSTLSSVPSDPMKLNDQLNSHASKFSNPPLNHDSQASFLARMPCVSTTGNGPNGKKVSGFLYRYTKNEVTIVCICHGQSFSPAGFVEHAGGVDVVHPLKHITIFPTAFAS